MGMKSNREHQLEERRRDLYRDAAMAREMSEIRYDVAVTVLSWGAVVVALNYVMLLWVQVNTGAIASWMLYTMVWGMLGLAFLGSAVAYLLGRNHARREERLRSEADAL